MGNISKYNSLTNQFEPIQLSEINQLKLMKRVDKKFVMPIENINDLLLNLKEHYKILEIEGTRDFSYHTTYFDTPNFDLYLNHQNQRLNRYKIRKRDYMVSNNTFLEVKLKNNKGRTIKTRTSIDPCANLNDEHYKYLKKVIPNYNLDLIKSCENTFQRITLVSFQTLERITIDYDISFFLNGKNIALPFISIVEVKRDKAGSNSTINNELKNLKVYPRGFSKYCIGLSYLIPEIKQNSFKKTKLFLNKLNYASHTN
jgi:hypothetical protein